MKQFAPATTLVPQLFENANEEALAPVTLMPEMDRNAVPVLDRITLCDALVVPTFWPPKVTPTTGPH